MSTHRVALGSIFTECNQLGGVPIDLSWFERYELHRGAAILGLKQGVVGGMLQVLSERGATPVPLLSTRTPPRSVSRCRVQEAPLTRATIRPLRTFSSTSVGRVPPRSTTGPAAVSCSGASSR